ncbi:unnamed protein product, partial [Ascophyllum nodosum]
MWPCTQLPLGRSIHRSALDCRKRLGLALSRLGLAALRRTQYFAWRIWMNETRRGIEQQRWNNSGSEAGRGASARDTVSTEKLLKPVLLDLPTIVAPGLVKNQGANMEEPFRAVGLTTVEGPHQTGNSSRLDSCRKNPFCLPDVFWKAVVLAPARSKGRVGGWLAAKLGGGDQGEIRLERAWPALKEGGSMAMVTEADREISCGSSATSKLIHRSVRKVPMGERTGSSEASLNPQRMHLCVNRISIEEGRRLGPSLELSRALEATSLVVFAATPRDQDRFFWSPLHPKPDWSKAREDLGCALRCTDSECGAVPLLVVISVQDSVLNRGNKKRPGPASLRECVLEDAWEGLGLQEVAQRGVSVRVTVVGLHEFESR